LHGTDTPAVQTAVLGAKNEKDSTPANTDDSNATVSDYEINGPDAFTNSGGD
jgi:hypothetical protein